ncbi:MAG: phytanoyl-CoA dioxygenase, partial [Lentisphaeria bacterium]|nr:phytanoyl-CoA dioxygenase [Lentisphaeria bacterium]
MSEPALLNDDELLSFIVNGYYLLKPDYATPIHQEVCNKLNALESNPGNGILEAVPELNEIYDHPMVKGALASILGADYTMNQHRHWHKRGPEDASQNWHQDGTNVRHHQTWKVLAM